MKILIAEDDITTRTIIQSLMTKWGYEMIVTCDGNEALEVLLSNDPPKIAILDLMMPGLNGLDVCRKVRKMSIKVPPYIILLTALSDKDDIVIGFMAGADDYITKPFDNEELQARVSVGKRVITLQTLLADKVTSLENAMEHIKTLQGILPVCSSCHRIRNDEESWERLEEYISEHSDAQFSHTLCPECVEQYNPGFLEKRRKKREKKS